MKKVSVILLLLISVVTYSQNSGTTAEIKKSTLTKLIYTVNSIEELKSINWNDVKDIFKEDNKEETIVLGFKVKGINKEEIKHSFEVKGKVSDIDNTIEITKKVIKVITKL